MTCSMFLWTLGRLTDQDIEDVLRLHWTPERDRYGWIVEAASSRPVFVENGNDGLEDVPPEMIESAAVLLGTNRVRWPQSRVVLMFNDQPDDVERHCAWYIGQAFGSRWPTVFDDLAGSQWLMGATPPVAATY